MRNAVALGTFDGLHKGHISVLNIPEGYNKIALTFEKPPKAVKTGEDCLLMTFEQKSKRLEEMGFSVETLKFNEVSNTKAEEFIKFIKKKFNPAVISCGFNYRFGKDGAGDTKFLKEFCENEDIILNVSDPVTKDGEVISSSRIRDLLKNGKICQANEMLSREFCFENIVIHGDKRGRKLSFPTLNQRYPEGLTPLKFGVYKTEIIVNGRKYLGVTDIGKRPTYPVDFIISETFIKDFCGDLYNKTVKIIPKEFLRNEIKFSSLEELKMQINEDLKQI